MHSTGLAIAACAALVVPPRTTEQEKAPPASRIELRVSPLADLWGYVRARAAPSATKDASGPELPGLDDAVAATKALDRRFGSSLDWGGIDRELEFATNCDELLSRLQSLPETRNAPSGPIALRESALALARAVAVVEPRFLDEVWPAHEAVITAAKARLEKTLMPHAAECLGDVLAHLELPDPGIVIPVYLVTEIPPFGGVTYARAERGGISFVAVVGPDGTQLDETVLHECTHALDVASPDGVGLIEALRAKLAAAGIDQRDARSHDLWHTIYFVEAAATIRRRVDPEHRPLGDAGYYAKVPLAVAIILPRWSAYLDGKLDRATLLEQLVAEAAKGSPPRH